jgi:hypothetical protein
VKRNGFITPTTLVISLILFSVLMHQIKLLEQERDFIFEEKQVLILEQLLQMSTTDLLREIHSNTEIENGSFDYANGTVSYSLIQNDGNEIGIRLKAVTKDGRTNQVVLYYNRSIQQLTQWTEV